MRIIRNTAVSPEYNLALEEHLVRTSQDDVFMLWRNAPSVIFGRSQNPWAELDTAFVASHGIKAIRRMTGGGAVFHDLGNVNFTFIKVGDVHPLDFAPFVSTIVSALAEFGIKAEADGRNDIVSDGVKISGNAQLIVTRDDGTKAQLHHGTLLFDADISSLVGALRVNTEKLKSKGVASVRSRVGNIKSLPGYVGPTTADGFLDALMAYAERHYSVKATEATADEIEQATALAKSKYASWDWSFGASPEFETERTARTPAGTVTVMFTAKNGVISSAKLCGDYFAVGDETEIEAALVGARLTEDGIKSALLSHGVEAEKIVHNLTNDALASLVAGETEGE